MSADTGLHLDYIDLARMPATIGAVRNPFLALHPDRHPSGAYAATLFGDWETFYAAKRSASTRKTVRKQLKQLARHGEPAFVLVEGAADRRATLDVLMAQKAQSLARMGVENFFEQPGYRDFFRDVIGDPALGGLVHISRLDAGAATAATGMGLTFGGSFYLILASYDGDLSAYGPGRAHLHEMLRHFIGEGYGRFDFTVGDEAYKRDWSDQVIDLYDYLAPVSLRGFVRVSATRLFRRAKRLIKQTPALWRMFSRLRARFGGGSTPAGHRDDAG